MSYLKKSFFLLGQVKMSARDQGPVEGAMMLHANQASW